MPPRQCAPASSAFLPLLPTSSPARYDRVFIPAVSPLALLALLYTVLVLYALQGERVVTELGAIARVAVPLLAYFALMWTAALAAARAFGWTYELAVTQAFTAASNNFELAIAVAVRLWRAQTAAPRGAHWRSLHCCLCTSPDHPQPVFRSPFATAAGRHIWCGQPGGAGCYCGSVGRGARPARPCVRCAVAATPPGLANAGGSASPLSVRCVPMGPRPGPSRPARLLNPRPCPSVFALLGFDVLQSLRQNAVSIVVSMRAAEAAAVAGVVLLPCCISWLPGSHTSAAVAMHRHALGGRAPVGTYWDLAGDRQT